MKFVLDTSAYIAFIKNHPQVVELIRFAESIVLPVIVIGELLYGYHKGSRFGDNMGKLNQFLRQGRVEIGVIDGAVAEQYGAIKQAQQVAGLSQADNDLWIAAVAKYQDLPILTLDTDFKHLPQVQLIPLNSKN